MPCRKFLFYFYFLFLALNLVRPIKSGGVSSDIMGLLSGLLSLIWVGPASSK